MTDGQFLLGNGEQLTEPIVAPGGGGGPDFAYSMDEALTRLSPMLTEAVQELDALPALACPEDQCVVEMALHPQSIAKTYHPSEFLRDWKLRQVGSRPITISPDQRAGKTKPHESPSTMLILAGERSSVRAWAAAVADKSSLIKDQIRRVERISAPDAHQRVRINSASDPSLLEIVLHADGTEKSDFIMNGFADYADSLGFEVVMDKRHHVGGLCFIPVWNRGVDVTELARFSFLRVARAMPTLRHPIILTRSQPVTGTRNCPLPTERPVDPTLRVAVLDGGLSEGTQLSPWVKAHNLQGLEAPAYELLEHGHDVTCAALFGPLQPGEPAPTPFAIVDHYQVLDANSGQTDPFELYDVLDRVTAVLSSGNHELINLSIGPALPVEDDEVHLWTAQIDQYLSDGKTLLTIAGGNNGDSSYPGEARIQVPADAVNGISVGAATKTPEGLVRAKYSAIGPGRSPGRTKPDLLHFGGDASVPFYVYAQGAGTSLAQQAGTSFAAPSVLRLASGIRAYLGARIQPLAMKAILIHHCESLPNPDRSHMGWGGITTNVEDMLICPDYEVSVLFQGELLPGKYLRAPIPLPTQQLKGKVTIKATFCYASPIDPQDPGSYTRSGLDITFRPDLEKFTEESSTIAKSASFFRKSDFDTEDVLRHDAHKWETVLSAEKTKHGTSLNKPVFDIHYTARSGGGSSLDARPIPYALIITIKSQHTPNLYDQVVRAYPGILVPLTPVISIPLHGTLF